MLTVSAQPSVGNLWTTVEDGLTQTCAAWKSGHFVPLLEADFAGYLYHVLVSSLDGDASQFHLDTRLVGRKTTARFDLVIGSVLNTEDQRKRMSGSTDVPEHLRKFINSKASLAVFRPAILPLVVLEFKAFPLGFTPQQHRVHFEDALKDITKLKDIKPACDGRGLVLFDGDRYFVDRRLAELLEARGREDADIRVYLCSGSPVEEACWHRH